MCRPLGAVETYFWDDLFFWLLAVLLALASSPASAFKLITVGGDASLTLVSSVIASNESDQGGHIYLDGPSVLIADGATYMTGNAAEEYGGGIAIFGPAAGRDRV